MKKLLTIGIIALMIAGLSVAANAAYVGTVLSLEPIYVGGSYQPVLVGWYSDKGDGAASADAYDSSDMGNGLTALPGQLRFNLGTISGAPSDLGTPCGDFRAPNVAGNGQTNAKRWLITSSIENNPDHIGGTFSLQASFNAGFAPVGTEFYIFAGTVSLANCKLLVANPASYLVKMTATNTTWTSSGSWTLATPTSGTSYDADNDMDITTWGPNPTQTFTVYAQAAPDVVTPEPGSMLAMLSGLVGLVGFGIRRRK